jgi:hypothetical protein
LQKLPTERRSRVSEQFLEGACVHTRRAAWKASFQTGVTPVWRAYNSAQILWRTIKPFEANSPRKLEHAQNAPGDAGESIWIGIS